MKIALDYDETFTEDPILWREFIGLCKERGHSVTFVTYRDERWGNHDIEYDAEVLNIPVVFTGGKQKAGKFKADVWGRKYNFLRSPEYIPVAKDLGDVYDKCLIQDDMGEEYEQ